MKNPIANDAIGLKLEDVAVDNDDTTEHQGSPETEDGPEAPVLVAKAVGDEQSQEGAAAGDDDSAHDFGTETGVTASHRRP